MTLLKTIRKPVAALSLTVLSAGFAHAHGPAVTTGSTDIYGTDFQKTFAGGNSAPQAQGAMGALGSVDIYRADFQKAFPSNPDAVKTAATEVRNGSVDIYSTDFQKDPSVTSRWVR